VKFDFLTISNLNNSKITNNNNNVYVVIIIIIGIFDLSYKFHECSGLYGKIRKKIMGI